MKAGTVLRFLDNGASRNTRFSMSADGYWLAGGSRNGRVLLWDLNRERKDYDTAADMPLQTGDAAAVVQNTAFGADGTLVAGLADGRVLAWKPEFVKDAAPQWETAATGSAITALSFDRAGSRVWSGDDRGELIERDGKVQASSP